MTRTITRSITSTSCALALLVLSGCPEEDKPIIIPPVTNNTTATNNANNTSNNTTGSNNSNNSNNTTGSNNSNNSNNTTGSNNSNNTAGPRDACANLQDKMILPSTEGTLRWSGDTTPATVTSAYQTSCGFGIAPEQAFAFTFEDPVQLKITLTSNSGTRMAYELVEGPCEVPGSPRFCATNSQVFLAQADTEYIIIVEPEANQARGTFDLELEVKPLVCLPVASKRCEGDDVKRCVAGGLREDTITCGSPCVGDTCGADSCDNAHVVKPGDYPYTFSAPAAGYGSSITFEGDNSCANPDRGILPGETNNADPTGESDPSLPTPGQDVHFTLEGLEQGQLLTVDASAAAGDSADSAIFILDACDKSECLYAKDLGDVVSQWEVPADGDYLVIVDRVSSSDQDLGVRIDVE